MSESSHLFEQVVEYEAIPLSYQEEERFRNLERLLVSTTERLRNKEVQSMKGMCQNTLILRITDSGDGYACTLLK